MSDKIINNISKMTTAEIVAAYTKDEVWQAFKEAQAKAGVNCRDVHILYQLYMTYDNLSQNAQLEGCKGVKIYNLSKSPRNTALKRK